MKVAIIGAGTVGISLGKSLSKVGHDVMFGSRTPQSEDLQKVKRETGIPVGTIDDALEFSDVIAFALPWKAVADVSRSLDDWSGKVIIDMSNRFGLPPERTTGSSAGDIARMTGARVVKVFNTIGAEHYQNPIFSGQPATMLIAGDDAHAKEIGAKLASDLGFEVVDAGNLAAAGMLEDLAALWIHLATQTGLGRDFAFKIIRK